MKDQIKSTKPSRMKPVAAGCLCFGLAIAGIVLFFSYRERRHKESIMQFEKYCLEMGEAFRSVIQKAEEGNKKPVEERRKIEVLDAASGQIQNVELGEIDSDTLQGLLGKDQELFWPEPESDIQYSFDYLPDTIINVFRKYEKGELVWETNLQTKGTEQGYVVLEEGIFIAFTENDENHSLHLFFLENDGRIRWEYRSKRGLGWWPKITALDGVLHVVSHEYQKWIINELNILTFDMEGNLLSEKTKEWDWTENVEVVKVAATKDGYAVMMYQYNAEGGTVIRKVSFDGELLGKTTFTAGGKNCIIHDILYHGGKLYVSLRILNKPTNTFYNLEVVPYRREYLAAYEERGEGIKPHDFDMGEEFNTRETNFFKEQYTAGVLVLEENGSVSGVCTVEGGSAGRLSLSGEGTPVWQVFRIDHVRFGIFSIKTTSAYIYSTEYAFGFNDGVWGDKRLVGYMKDEDPNLTYDTW